jgi:Xaa-Pro aminopeptidase
LKRYYSVDDSCWTIYINTNEHYRAAVETETREARALKWKDKYPAHTVAKSNNFTTHSFCKRRIRPYTTSMYHYRKRFRRVLSCETQCDEYEIEAEFIHEFIRNRSSFSYTPIIGSGNNANVLHYIENNQQCKLVI